jgi:glycine/D-amino acid oxidase-like deaminating enzyme
MHDKVDVLIIGSGASGAAVAWQAKPASGRQPLEAAAITSGGRSAYGVLTTC